MSLKTVNTINFPVAELTKATVKKGETSLFTVAPIKKITSPITKEDVIVVLLQRY